MSFTNNETESLQKSISDLTNETENLQKSISDLKDCIKRLETIVNQEAKTDDECKNEIFEFLKKNCSKLCHAIALGAISSAIGIDTPYYKVGQTDVTSGDIAKNFALGAGWGAVTGTITQATDIRVAGGMVTGAISGGAAHGLKYFGRAINGDEGENWADFLIIICSLLLEIFLLFVIPFAKKCYNKCCNKRTGTVGRETTTDLS